MNKAQLNAISYSYTRKKQAEAIANAERLNLLTAFEYQTTFKTLQGFLNAYETKSKQFYQANKQAADRIRLKIKCVEGCNNNPDLVIKLKNYNEFLKNI